MRLCVSFNPIAMTRGNIIFRNIAVAVSIAMRCAWYKCYFVPSALVVLAKDFPVFSSLIFHDLLGGFIMDDL